MNSNYINIGIIGCGRVAQHYKKLFETDEINDFRIYGCYDIDENIATQYANTFSAKVYSSLNEILNEDVIDLYIILTPSGHHYEQAKKVITAGKNVLIEKPTAMIPLEILNLEKLAKEHEVFCGAIFQNRFNPAIEVLHKAFKNNRFGEIISVSVRLKWCRYQEYYNDDWHGTWLMDGGVINQQAIHHIDAMNWICGPVVKCCAFESNRSNELEAEDTMVAIFSFANGSSGTLEVTTAARPEDIEASISVLGNKGVASIGGIALNEVNHWEFIDKIPDDEFVSKKYSQAVETGYGLGHVPLLNEVIQKIKNGDNQSPVTLKDSYNTTLLVHALYKSVEKEEWIYLADNPVSERLGK